MTATTKIISQICGILLIVGSCFAQSETKIQKDSLPISVKEHLYSHFHDYSISNVVKENNNGIITYKLEARKEKSDEGGVWTTTIFFLTYTTEGKIVSKRKEKEEYYTDPPKNKVKHNEHDHIHNAPMPNY